MDLNTTPPTTEMPVVGRPILDANIGMTNRIEHDDICEIMIDTFQDISRVLSDHCGPYGQFAMITTPNNRVAEPVFTKDGINIVRAMEYMSPMEEFVRNTLAYMGSRIETAAGDGTTSSMIICAEGLVTLLSRLKRTKQPYSYNEMMSAYATFVDVVCKKLDKEKYTIEKLMEIENAPSRNEIIRKIAFHQAYTSSHGNKELSQAVADLFASTPEKAWNYMYIDKCKFETDKTYQVEVDETQYTIQNVRIWPTSALSDDLGTKRVRKNSKMIISGVAPAFGFEEGKELYEMIVHAIENDEELAVVCPNNIDNAATNQLTDLFNKHIDHKVAIFFVNDQDPRLNDIVCIKALLNKFDIHSECSVDYTYEHGDLKIDAGLYEPTESKLIPMVGDPEYKSLNLLIDNLDKIIKQIKSEVSNRSNNQEVARLQKFRMKLTVAKRSYFLIGGAAYDNAAAVDVVIDAILAVKHSLAKGFGLGGNRTLYSVLEDIQAMYSGEYRTLAARKQAKLIEAYCQLFKQGIMCVHAANLKWFEPRKIAEGLALPIVRFDYSCSLDITAINPDKITKDMFYPHCMLRVADVISGCNDAMTSKNGPALIIQPITADIELVKRFGELALKFVRTQRIITPGGVCTLPKKDDSEQQNP